MREKALREELAESRQALLDSQQASKRLSEAGLISARVEQLRLHAAAQDDDALAEEKQEQDNI